MTIGPTYGEEEHDPCCVCGCVFTEDEWDVRHSWHDPECSIIRAAWATEMFSGHDHNEPSCDCTGDCHADCCPVCWAEKQLCEIRNALSKGEYWRSE